MYNKNSYLCSAQSGFCVFLDRTTDFEVVFVTSVGGLDVKFVKNQVQFSTCSRDDPFTVLVIRILAGVVGGCYKHCTVSSKFIGIKGDLLNTVAAITRSRSCCGCSGSCCCWN
jgi:hypothetical protein